MSTCQHPQPFCFRAGLLGAFLRLCHAFGGCCYASITLCLELGHGIILRLYRGIAGGQLGLEFRPDAIGPGLADFVPYPAERSEDRKGHEAVQQQGRHTLRIPL